MDEPRLIVVFYKSQSGNEPVREFFKSLSLEDKKSIGEDIKTVQFGWPLGMPLIRKIDAELWEIRSNISKGILRVFFTIHGKHLILLHAFIKKSPKTPMDDLATAKNRLSGIRGNE
jgi:phage-related protein